MTTELKSLREQLLKLNKEIIKSFEERKKIVRNIQSQKVQLKLDNFDPTREMSLFMALKDEIKKLSLLELASLSLIMESQAKLGPTPYPSWSSGDHLEKRSESIKDFINPILLKVYDSSLFIQGPEFVLKKEFEDILSALFTEQ